MFLLRTVLLLFTFYLTVHATADCEYKHDFNTYYCTGINQVFPSKYYGNYHLKCDHCKIPIFTKDTFPHDNTLISFNMTGSIVLNLTAFSFAKLTSLQYIYLQNVHLENISTDAFNGLRQVYELHLEGNNLKSLSPKFLNGFEASTILLSNNKLEEIPSDIFEGNLGVMYLDISNNRLNKLYSDSFKYLDGLEFLSLEDNSLCKLPFGLFRHVRLLKELNLSGNRLKKFGPGIFSGLRNVQHVNLSRNEIGNFVPEMLLPLARISTLDLSRNGLQFINAPDLHTNAPTLRHLSINDNHWYCPVLVNVVQYLRTVNVESIPLGEAGRYAVTNVNGIACCETVIEERISYDRFLKVVEHFTKQDYDDAVC